MKKGVWWKKSNHKRASELSFLLWKENNDNATLDGTEKSSFERLTKGSWFDTSATSASSEIHEIWPLVEKRLAFLDAKEEEKRVKSEEKSKGSKEERIKYLESEQGKEFLEKKRKEAEKREKIKQQTKDNKRAKKERELKEELENAKSLEDTSENAKKRKAVETKLKTFLQPKKRKVVVKKEDDIKVVQPEQKTNPKEFVSRQIRLKLDKEQEALLRRWFDAKRWTYNQCVAKYRECVENVLKTKEQNPERKATSDDFKQCKKFDLCQQFVNELSPVFQDPKNKGNKIHLLTPYDIRHSSVQEFCVAYKVNKKKFFENQKTGDKKFRFKMHFRSFKDVSESLTIPHRSYNSGIICPSFWVNYTAGATLQPLKPRKPKKPNAKVKNLPKTIAHDFLIVRKRKKFYLSVPVEMPTRRGVPLEGFRKHRNKDDGLAWMKVGEPTNARIVEPPKQKIVSIDPGDRTFATLYDPDGVQIDWSPQDKNRLRKLCLWMDNLQSRMDTEVLTFRRKQRMKRALDKMRLRVQNLVKEVHRKLCKFLCENYNVILIPEFASQGMSRKRNRKIRSSTVRSILTWSHYKFRMMLLQKAKEHPWVRVIVCSEEYTSKTCGNCGLLHQKLGANKTFSCPSCKYTIDRDVNGARNILLKWLLSFSEKQMDSFPQNK